MRKRRRNTRPPKPTRGFSLLVLLLWLLCSVPVGWAGYRTVLYFRTSPRFEVQKLSVAGLKRVEENQVLSQARFGLGMNVFKVGFDEIRERVEELQWVQHAVVERILPDQIIIKIVEREPIGLARIRGEVYQFDGEARILDPDPASRSSFSRTVWPINTSLPRTRASSTVSRDWH